jgi:1-acyl-sn-glycerol-3-phosphate acyltransferase
MKILYILRHILLVGDYFSRAWVLNLIHRDPLARRRALIRNVSRSGRNFCKSLQISATVHNPQRLHELRDKAYLMVSNHVSYTDILVLAALEDLVFITSVEMGNNPFLGAITRLGGCLFTDRKNPVSLKDEIQRFSDTIAEGFKVLLFPEGTSTDGTGIRDFRRSLFQIALNVNCPILPVCIKYTKIDGEPITDSNRDLIAWYGDMTFAPHFLKLLNHKIEVEIHFLESIAQPAGKSRTELSDGVLKQIRDCFDAIGKSV